MFRKSQVLFLFILILMLLLNSSCKKDDIQDSTLKFGVLRVEDALPVYLSQELDMFKDDVEVLIFSNTREMDMALESAVIDGILSDLVRTILLKSGDEDIRIVASASPNTLYKRKFAIVASPESNIKSLKELEGRELGISDNSIISFLTDKIFLENNIDIEKISYKAIPDIKLRFESLINNSLETAMLPEPLVTSAEKEGGNVISSDLDLSKNYSQTVYIFRQEYLNTNADEVKRFLEVIVSAGKELNRNPKQYSNIIAEKAGISEDLLKDYKITSIEERSLPDGKLMEEVNQWMLNKNLTGKSYLYEELVDSQFLGDSK